MLKARQGCFGGIQQIAQHRHIAGHILDAGFAMRCACSGPQGSGQIDKWFRTPAHN
jgi:hypothetical protein